MFPADVWECKALLAYTFRMQPSEIEELDAFELDNWLKQAENICQILSQKSQ